ncbi:Nitrate/nitrite sensor protein NarX [Actinokineospora sp. UTMC 2448]|nr:Nitrate/nitrite sensor protein NarX [Actinokineospora sp. UTMC 2448]
MPQHRRHPAPNRENATAGTAVPRPRADAHDRADQPEPADRGGGKLSGVLPRQVPLRLPRALVSASPRTRALASDAAAVVLAALDVWLVVPEEPPWYSPWFSWLAVAALLLRRHLPFVTVLLCVPGFFFGWAQLAAMIALGSLAKRELFSWKTAAGALLVCVCRFVLWPWTDFLDLTWKEHILDAMYGVLVAGMPVAIGMLITVRGQLSARIRDLARSQDREKRLHAATVRAAERAKLAREMHDVVSHQVTLIAMQAGALQVSTTDPESREAAATIRALSTQTLEELRELVGVLRSGGDEEEIQPGLDEVDALVHDGVAMTISVDPLSVPAPISRAAYRTVQEALTNVRKHAGGARTSVLVKESDGHLEIEVRNSRPRRRSPGFPSGGHGLLGLRERATLLSGTLDAGPTTDGGYRVIARYPL